MKQQVPNSAKDIVNTLLNLTEDSFTKQYLNKIQKYLERSGDISVYKTKIIPKPNMEIYGVYNHADDDMHDGGYVVINEN
jgi:hypothetical protein